MSLLMNSSPFIEKNEWSFGGGYKTIIDGYYMNGDGTRGKSILDE